MSPLRGRCIGRARRRLSAFLLTLSYSPASWLEFFFDQSLENLLLRHVQAVHDWEGDAIHFHSRLLELSAHYHFTKRPGRPARGNEKTGWERATQSVRHNFFAARPFTTLTDFNLCLAKTLSVFEINSLALVIRRPFATPSARIFLASQPTLVNEICSDLPRYELGWLALVWSGSHSSMGF